MTLKSSYNGFARYHTTQTLLRSGLPSKLSSRESRKLVRDVTVNPTMILKDLQGSMSEMGVGVNQSIISCSLHKADLVGRSTRQLPDVTGKVQHARLIIAAQVRELRVAALDAHVNLKLN